MSLPQLDDDFFRKQLYLFTGKGGVGKSLTSLALARNLARRGRRTLWMEMAEVPKASHCFPRYHGSYEPVSVEPNLYCSHFQLRPAIDEYMEIVFRLPMLARSIANNSFFQIFTEALPGLESLVVLGRLEYELLRRKGGRPVWDSIIFDAPATGHALTLLRFPRAAREIVRMGPVFDSVNRQQAILADPRRTAMVVATLPEELPVTETAELVRGIHECGFRTHSVWVNGTFATDTASLNPTILRGAGYSFDDATLRERGDFLSHWRGIQQNELARLREYCAELQVSVVTLPYVGGTLADQTLTMAHALAPQP